MYPHERSLVDKMKDKPFVLIGVNTDKRETGKKAVKDNNLTWRSFSDGSTSGKICKAWFIRSFPSIFVIDHKGKIRHMNLRGDPLEKAIEKLVEEAEAGGGG